MSDLKEHSFIYADASYSKQAQKAILGYFIFDSVDQHNRVPATQLKPVLTEVIEANNIRAELRGVIWALTSFTKTLRSANVVLYTDCQTVSGLIRRRENLEACQFVSKSKNQPLRNTDLYKEFYKIYDVVQPQVVWVRGHSPQATASLVEANFAVLDRAVRHHLRQRVQQ